MTVAAAAQRTTGTTRRQRVAWVLRRTPRRFVDGHLAPVLARVLFHVGHAGLGLPELLAGNGYHIDDGFSGPGFAFAIDHYLRTPWVVVVALDGVDRASSQGSTSTSRQVHAAAYSKGTSSARSQTSEK